MPGHAFGTADEIDDVLRRTQPKLEVKSPD